MKTIERDELKGATRPARGVPPRHGIKGESLPGEAHPRAHTSSGRSRSCRSGSSAMTILCSTAPAGRAWRAEIACKMLTDLGYIDAKHYPGGIIEWEDAGYPIEGGGEGEWTALTGETVNRDIHEASA